MSAVRTHTSRSGRGPVKAAGDRAWSGAGRQTVKRLASVVAQGAKAIQGHVDNEAVHDLRTATRRLRTAIKLHGQDAPKKRRATVEDELKRVTRRLGAVRDLDIMLETLGRSAPDLPGQVGEEDLEPLRNAWRAERAVSVRHLTAELDRRRFRHAIREAQRLVVREDGPGRKKPASLADIDRIATKAPGLIWASFGAVLAYRIDPKTADPADIHRLRIAAKKLRYTLEAFEDALEPGKRLIDDVTALQDAAGSMHDAIVAADRAHSTVKRDTLTEPQRRAVDAFAEARRQEAEQLRPTIARRLRTVRSRSFRESLGHATAGVGHVSP